MTGLGVAYFLLGGPGNLPSVVVHRDVELAPDHGLKVGNGLSFPLRSEGSEICAPGRLEIDETTQLIR
jgi:hypothetical protein